MRRSLVVFVLFAGMLAGCENPFTADYHPLASLPQALEAQEITVQMVDDLAAGEAAIAGQGLIKLGEARFEAPWMDPEEAREQAVAVGAELVLIEQKETRIETIKHVTTELEVSHGKSADGSRQVLEEEVPVYEYEERQWYAVKASFWRAPE